MLPRTAFAVVFSLTIVWSSSALRCMAQEQTDQAPTQKVAVPAAPEDKEAKQCRKYLENMNGIVQAYDQCVTETLTGPQGVNVDEKAMKSAASRTLKLVKQLKKVRVPDEIADAHKQFAQSLPTLHDFFVLNHGNSRSLNKAFEVIGEIQQTLNTYHQGILTMIENHHLDPALDPVAAEQTALTQRALQGAQQWATQAAGALQQLMQQQQQMQQQQVQQQNSGSAP